MQKSLTRYSPMMTEATAPLSVVYKPSGSKCSHGGLACMQDGFSNSSHTAEGA